MGIVLFVYSFFSLSLVYRVYSPLDTYTVKPPLSIWGMISILFYNVVNWFIYDVYAIYYKVNMMFYITPGFCLLVGMSVIL